MSPTSPGIHIDPIPTPPRALRGSVLPMVTTTPCPTTGSSAFWLVLPHVTHVAKKLGWKCHVPERLLSLLPS